MTTEDVALTAVELLDKEVNGWFDVLEGDEDIKDAVESSDEWCKCGARREHAGDEGNC